MVYTMSMTQIEDTAGTTADVNNLGEDVELTIAAMDYYIDDEDGMVTVSQRLTPRQARALARQLLAQADAAEYGDED